MHMATHLFARGQYYITCMVFTRGQYYIICMVFTRVIRVKTPQQGIADLLPRFQELCWIKDEVAGSKKSDVGGNELAKFYLVHANRETVTISDLEYGNMNAHAAVECKGSAPDPIALWLLTKSSLRY